MPNIAKFLEGFKKFRNENFLPRKAHYEDLAINGQSPDVMIISCSDSRVALQTLLDAESGELFVVRNVANLVPHFAEGDMHLSTTAALEFAVVHLKISDIIIMGHSECGGIHTLMTSIEKNEPCNITSWVSSYDEIREVVMQQYHDKSFDEKCHACEKLAVIQSLEHLAEYPWIKERLDDGSLRCHPWYYDLKEGMIYEIQQPSGDLRPLID